MAWLIPPDGRPIFAPLRHDPAIDEALVHAAIEARGPVAAAETLAMIAFVELEPDRNVGIALARNVGIAERHDQLIGYGDISSKALGSARHRQKEIGPGACRAGARRHLKLNLPAARSGDALSADTPCTGCLPCRALRRHPDRIFGR